MLNRAPKKLRAWEPGKKKLWRSEKWAESGSVQSRPPHNTHCPAVEWRCSRVPLYFLIRARGRAADAVADVLPGKGGATFEMPLQMRGGLGPAQLFRCRSRCGVLTWKAHSCHPPGPERDCGGDHPIGFTSLLHPLPARWSARGGWQPLSPLAFSSDCHFSQRPPWGWARFNFIPLSRGDAKIDRDSTKMKGSWT